MNESASNNNKTPAPDCVYVINESGLNESDQEESGKGTDPAPSPERREEPEKIYSLSDHVGEKTSLSDEDGSPTQAERIILAEESVPTADVYGIQNISAPFFARSTRKKEPSSDNTFADTDTVGGDTEELSMEEIYARKRKQTLQKQLAGEDELGFELKRSELPAHPFWTRIFSPFFYPGLILRLILMTGVALVPFFLCTLLFSRMLEQHFIESDRNLWEYLRCLWEDRIILTSFCFLWGVVSIPFSLNIFSATSDGDDHIIDWPDYSFVGGMGQFLWLIFLILCAGIPGWLLGQFFGFGQIGFLAGILFLTPIFFLSSMDADSPIIMLTGDVLTSFRRVTRSWVIFYLISIVLFDITLMVGVGALCLIHRSGTTMGAIFATSLVISFLLSFMPMLYLRWLGRLAWVIEDANRKYLQKLNNESVETE